MIGQQFKAEYERELLKLPETSFYSIYGLKEKISRRGPFARSPNDPGFEVFGIIRLVTALKATPFCANSKEIYINDPTDEAGLNVTVKGKTELLLPGNIVKLSHVHHLSGERFVVDAKFLVQYHSFSYDYEQHTNFDESSYIAHPFEEHPDDEGVCQVLEKWVTADILLRRFHQFEKVRNKRYADFVAQIIEQRMMYGSLVLTLWDGSDPGTSIDDPYKPEYAHTYTMYGNNYSVRTNDAIKSYIPMNKYVYVNVWRNTSDSGNDHFERAAHFQLKNGDDLILMLNVEVAPNKHGFEYPIQLNMRSGHHQGKGVRVVKRHSILGKAFSKILAEEMEKFIVEGDVSDSDIVEEDMDGFRETNVVHDGDDRIFEHETSINFQTLPTVNASTPSSPSRKKARTLLESSPSVKTGETQTTTGQVVPSTSESVKPVSSGPIKKTVITVDLDDPEIKSLLSKFPSHIGFSTLVAMDVDELNEYETLLLEVDDWVEADIREFGKELSRESLIEIIKLARTVKSASSPK